MYFFLSIQNHSLLLLVLTAQTTRHLLVLVLSIATLRMVYFVFFVGTNDALHQIVPHYVFVGELLDPYAHNVAANFERFHQPALFPNGKINLSDIAGYDRLGIEAQPSQKHFHLLAGGVLRFVQNYKSVIQRASAHER